MQEFALMQPLLIQLQQLYLFVLKRSWFCLLFTNQEGIFPASHNCVSKQETSRTNGSKEWFIVSGAKSRGGSHVQSECKTKNKEKAWRSMLSTAGGKDIVDASNQECSKTFGDLMVLYIMANPQYIILLSIVTLRTTIMHLNKKNRYLQRYMCLLCYNIHRNHLMHTKASPPHAH